MESRIWRHSLLLLCLVLPSSLFSGARKPATEAQNYPEKKIFWVRDGKARKLKVTEINKKAYFKIGVLARLSGAQLRWQSVTDQACLSRVDGLLCFNWDRSQIYSNGAPIGKKYKLFYEDNELYVPVAFTDSGVFESFSGSKIAWKPRANRLNQNGIVNLVFPPVENLGDRYQVTVNMSEKIPYQVIEQTSERLWFRFLKGRFAKSQILQGDNVVQEVRINQKRRSADFIVTLGPKASGFDVTFDAKKSQLLIDVTSGEGTAVKKVAKTKLPAPAPGPIPTRKKYRPVADKSIRTIVIDAGHGGIDSGAIGTRGTLEKRINLKVARALAKTLSKQKNLRVILTRNDDTFLPLGERTRIANEAKADLFVSIHCNSSLSSKSNGFEVYLLSPEATDEAAAAVARIENSVIQLEAKKGTKPSKLEDLLTSMAIYNFINESSEAAAYLCQWVKKKSPVRKTAVREANFFVLRGAQMPGVLVELEYLSNPISELKLRSSRFRSRMVKGLAAGVLEYDRRAREKQRAQLPSRPAFAVTR